MDAYEWVHESLITLGLNIIEHAIGNYLENDSRHKCVNEVLGHFLSEEVKGRRPHRYETKLKYSSFSFRKIMGEFDFSFPEIH